MDNVRYRKSYDKPRNDYLDYILKLDSQNGLSDLEITGHAFTYYLNGFETSSAAITFLIYELALNSDIQKKCRDEIKTVLKNYGNNLTAEVLSELKYTETVIFENLRKNSPLAILSRVCTKNYEFQLNGENVTVEKDTIIVIPSKAIHHDSQYYPNPEEFQPDRFSDANNVKLPFFGFGDGPRICLGRNFAILQMKIFLVAILSEFSVKLNKKTQVPYNSEFLQILNVAKNEIYVDFEKISED